MTTTKNRCPLFEPCFIDYDRGVSFYSQLSTVQEAILGRKYSSLTPPPAGADVLVGSDNTAADVEPSTMSAAGSSGGGGSSAHTALIDGALFVGTAKLWEAVGKAPLKLRLRVRSPPCCVCHPRVSYVCCAHEWYP
jgi:hypothetical protein